MSLNIPTLQAIGPDAEIVDIEDNSPDKASGPQRENEDVEEALAEEEDEDETVELAEDEVEELAEDENEGVAEGETIGASTSHAPVERGTKASSHPPKKQRKIIPVDPDVIPNRSGKEPCPYWQCLKNDKTLRLF